MHLFANLLSNTSLLNVYVHSECKVLVSEAFMMAKSGTYMNSCELRKIEALVLAAYIT